MLMPFRLNPHRGQKLGLLLDLMAHEIREQADWTSLPPNRQFGPNIRAAVRDNFPMSMTSSDPRARDPRHGEAVIDPALVNKPAEEEVISTWFQRVTEAYMIACKTASNQGAGNFSHEWGMPALLPT